MAAKGDKALEQVILVGVPGPSRAVYQHHFRGILQSELLRTVRKHWPDEDLAKEFELVVLTKPLDQVTKAVADAEDPSKALKKFLRPATPSDKLEDLWHVGSLHGDLRILHPSGDFAFGWTLDTGKACLQHIASGDLVPVHPDRFLEPDEKMIVVEPKAIMAPSWLDIVTPKRPRLETEGPSPKNAYVWEFRAELRIVFGVQKSDFLEYFIEHPHNGWERWDVKLLELPQGQTWVMHRPQPGYPYALTHAKPVEEAKAKDEGITMIWNPAHLETLVDIGYEPMWYNL